MPNARRGRPATCTAPRARPAPVRRRRTTRWTMPTAGRPCTIASSRSTTTSPRSQRHTGSPSAAEARQAPLAAGSTVPSAHSWVARLVAPSPSTTTGVERGHRQAPPDRRLGGDDQQAVVAAGAQAGHGAHGVAAHPVGDEPLSRWPPRATPVWRPRRRKGTRSVHWSRHATRRALACSAPTGSATGSPAGTTPVALTGVAVEARRVRAVIGLQRWATKPWRAAPPPAPRPASSGCRWRRRPTCEHGMGEHQPSPPALADEHRPHADQQRPGDVHRRQRGELRGNSAADGPYTDWSYSRGVSSRPSSGMSRGGATGMSWISRQAPVVSAEPLRNLG